VILGRNRRGSYGAVLSTANGRRALHVLSIAMGASLHHCQLISPARLFTFDTLNDVKAPAQPTGDTPFKASPPFVDNSNFKALPVRYAPTWHFPSANTRATRAQARAHGAEPAGPSGRSDYFIMRCQWPRLAAGTGAGPDPALAQSGNAKRVEGHPSRKCV
jgi:hypothetical protein